MRGSGRRSTCWLPYPRSTTAGTARTPRQLSSHASGATTTKAPITRRRPGRRTDRSGAGSTWRTRRSGSAWCSGHFRGWASCCASKSTQWRAGDLLTAADLALACAERGADPLVRDRRLVDEPRRVPAALRLSRDDAGLAAHLHRAPLGRHAARARGDRGTRTRVRSALPVQQPAPRAPSRADHALVRDPGVLPVATARRCWRRTATSTTAATARSCGGTCSGRCSIRCIPAW